MNLGPASSVSYAEPVVAYGLGAAELFVLSDDDAQNIEPSIGPLWYIHFLLTGTNIPAATAANESFSLLHSNPVRVDQLGKVPVIYLDNSVAYDVVYSNQFGVVKYTIENFSLAPLNNFDLGIALESNTALVALAPTPPVDLVAAAELDVARPALVSGQPLVILNASEADAAQTVGITALASLQPASELDSVEPLGITITATLSVAAELDSAEAVATNFARILGQAAETDSAGQITFNLPASLSGAVEADSAESIAVNLPLSLAAATESDSAETISFVAAGESTRIVSPRRSVMALDSFSYAGSSSLIGRKAAGLSSAWIATGFAGTAASDATSGGGGSLTITSDNLGCTIEAGESDGIISVDWTPQSGDRNSVVFRRSDNDNMLAFSVRVPNGDANILKTDSGIGTTEASSSFSFTAGQTYRLSVLLSGSSITCLIDGAVVLTHSDSFNQNATQHGLLRNGGASTHTFERFQFSSAEVDSAEIRETSSGEEREASYADRDPLFSAVSFLLKAGSLTTDSSLNQFGVTAQNGVTLDTQLGPFGYADSVYDFNDSGQLVFPQDASLQLGLGDFCYEGFFKFDSFSSGNIILSMNNVPTNNVRWHIEVSSENSIFFFHRASSGSSSFSITGTGLTAGVWHHIAIVRESGVFYVFADGALAGSSARAFDYDVATVMAVSGRRHTSWGFMINGVADELRLTKGYARYNLSGFTPPSSPLPAQ